MITIGTLILTLLPFTVPAAPMARDDGDGVYASLAVDIGLSQVEVGENNDVVNKTGSGATREAEVFPTVSGHIGVRMAATGTGVALGGDDGGEDLSPRIRQYLGDAGSLQAAFFWEQYDVWQAPLTNAIVAPRGGWRRHGLNQPGGHVRSLRTAHFSYPSP